MNGGNLALIMVAGGGALGAIGGGIIASEADFNVVAGVITGGLVGLVAGAIVAALTTR